MTRSLPGIITRHSPGLALGAGIFALFAGCGSDGEVTPDDQAPMAMVSALPSQETGVEGLVVGFPLAILNLSGESAMILVGSQRVDLAHGDKTTLAVPQQRMPLRVQLADRFVQDTVPFDQDAAYILVADRDVMRLRKVVEGVGYRQLRAYQAGKAPDNLPPAQESGMFARYLERAQAAFAAGRYDDAARDLTALRMMDPGNQQVWMLVGRAEGRLGRLSEASDALNRAWRLESPAQTPTVSPAQLKAKVAILARDFQEQVGAKLSQSGENAPSAVGAALAKLLTAPEEAARESAGFEPRFAPWGAVIRGIAALAAAGAGKSAGLSEAWEAFSQAREAGPHDSYAHFGAGLVAWCLGKSAFVQAFADLLAGLEAGDAATLPALGIVRPGWSATLAGFAAGQ